MGLKSSVGASISNKYNLSRFGIGDDRDSQGSGSSGGLSALRSRFNLPNLNRFGNNDADVERGDLGRLGSSSLGSSLRSKLSLPGRGNEEMDGGKPSGLGISSELRNKYNLTNLVSNIQSSWQSKFMGSNPSNSSSNNILDSMRPNNNNLSMDKYRDSSSFMNEKDRMAEMRGMNNRDNNDRERNERDRKGNSEDHSPEGSDNDGNESTGDPEEEGNDKEKFTFESEDEKDDNGDDLPML
jgi:hypothetical protein